MNLMLGDCIEKMREIPDGSVDMVLCDMPYGTTQNKWDTILDLQKVFSELLLVTKQNAAILLFAANPFTGRLIMERPELFKYHWVWKKSQAVGHLNAWRQPMRNTEDICVFYRKQPIYFPILQDKKKENIRPQTARTRTTENYGAHKLDVFKCPNDKTMPSTVLEFCNAQKTVHPTQKPVDLCEYLIKTYTLEGETVLDFTMGSGTTGVACKNLSRKFIGIEKDEKYFEIAKARIEAA